MFAKSWGPAVVPILLGAGICFSAAEEARAAADTIEGVTQQLSDVLEKYKRQTPQGAGYEVAFRRDPMQPLVDPQGELLSSAGLYEGLWVQGIIWSETRPLVVADDELFAVGDRVGPYKILKIEPDRIVVQAGEDEPQEIALNRGVKGLESSH